MVAAFEAARAADPDAVLFTNDYHLESKPAKLASYMRLIEQLLSAGVPLGGIGCQTHLDADLPAGARLVVAGVHTLVEGETVRAVEEGAPVLQDVKR